VRIPYFVALLISVALLLGALLPRWRFVLAGLGVAVATLFALALGFAADGEGDTTPAGGPFWLLFAGLAAAWVVALLVGSFLRGRFAATPRGDRDVARRRERLASEERRGRA
jgi:hypothetical protein